SAPVDVLAVHRVQQAAGLVAEADASPDVADALDVVELEAPGACALAQAGEESDGDAHVLDHASRRTLSRDGHVLPLERRAGRTARRPGSPPRQPAPHRAAVQ